MIAAVVPAAPDQHARGDNDPTTESTGLLPFGALLAALVVAPDPAPAATPPAPATEAVVVPDSRGAVAEPPITSAPPLAAEPKPPDVEVPAGDATPPTTPMAMAAPEAATLGHALPTPATPDAAAREDRGDTRTERPPTPRPAGDAPQLRASFDAATARTPDPTARPDTTVVPPTHVTTAPNALPATVDASAPPPPAPAPVPQPLDHSRLAHDLRARIEPLRATGDGGYEVHVELHPAELGHVEVDVRIQDGVVHLRLHADHADARSALHDALPDLRSSLEHAGVTTGDLHFDDRRAPGRDAQRDAELEPVTLLGPPRVAPALAPGDVATDDDAVDLLL